MAVRRRRDLAAPPASRAAVLDDAAYLAWRARWLARFVTVPALEDPTKRPGAARMRRAIDATRPDGPRERLAAVEAVLDELGQREAAEQFLVALLRRSQAPWAAAVLETFDRGGAA